MSAPTLDKPPATSWTSPTAARRRRRPLLLLVAASLVLVAAVAGASLALVNQPSTRQPIVAAGPTDVAAPDQPIVQDAGQNAKPDQPAGSGEGAGTRQETGSEQGSGSGQGTGTGSGGGREQTPVLPDGRHNAYISKVDAGRNQIVVDVVQVFLDGDAVKAAIADGKSRSEARYLTTWVRNANPRLRTLPLTNDLRVELRDTCDEPAGRGAMLDRLAANARQGIYYYTLTVSDGTVQRIQERLAINAC
jgi:hypothetical protein